MKDKHFSFILNMIENARNMTGNDGKKYYDFFRSIISEAQKLSDDEIDRINRGEFDYRLNRRQA